jgi:hypothetical protein
MPSSRKPRRKQPSNPRQPSKPRRGDGPGQVGKRPTAPGFLFAVGLVWVLCGVYALVALSASWKLIPGVVFIGIGLFWLRGAITAAARRDPSA